MNFSKLVLIVVWPILEVVLIVGGFAVLWRRYRLLGVVIGLLTVPVIPPIYAISDFVSRQFPRAPNWARLAITVAAVVVVIGPAVLPFAGAAISMYFGPGGFLGPAH